MAFCTAMRSFSPIELARGLGRRWRGDSRKFIFLYHRIASPEDDPFALAVSENWFQDHLEILRSHCRLVSLDEILCARVAKSSVVASITFDDGYADNLRTAAPMCSISSTSTSRDSRTSRSRTPPSERRTNLRFSDRAMDFASEVFPTPGGPTKPLQLSPR